MNQTVSVCIPMYNGEKYLRDCLDSVLSQSYWDLEILCVDDQSSDSTVDIVKEYAALDDRIKLHINEENLGLVGNWNKCIELATADYIKYVFQDDVIHPECIAKKMEAIEGFDCPICACRRDFIIENNASKNIRKYFQYDIKKPEHFFGNTDYISADQFGEVAKNFPLANLVGEPSVFLFHKSVIDKMGAFDATFSQLVDFEFVLRMISEFGFVFIPETLAYFRVHGGAESDKNTSLNRSKEKFFKVEYIDNLLFLNKILKNPEFKNYRDSNDLTNYENKFHAIVMNFINEQGKDEMLKTLQPFFQDHFGLEESIEDEIDFYNLNHEVIPLEDLEKTDTNTICWIDQVNEQNYTPGSKIESKSAEHISIKGWALDETTDTIASGVYIEINGKPYQTIYGMERKDVAEHFSKEEYTYCGFYTRIPVSNLKEGENKLSFMVVDQSKKKLFNCEQELSIHILK